MSLVSSLFAATAVAETPDPGLEAPKAMTAADAARERDASIDRGFLTPHAETIGAGNWSINSYELFFLGVSYAPTDDFEVALTTSLPIVEEFPLLIALAPKYVVHRGDSTAVAVRGQFAYLTQLSDNDFDIGMFSAGIVIDQYFDDAGRFALHASFSVGGAFGAVDDGDFDLADGVLFQLDVGFTAGVADIVKLLVEIQAAAANTSAGFEVGNIVLVNYGVRFHGKSLAADLGFIRPVGEDTGELDLILGYPFVAFSARF